MTTRTLYGGALQFLFILFSSSSHFFIFLCKSLHFLHCYANLITSLLLFNFWVGILFHSLFFFFLIVSLFSFFRTQGTSSFEPHGWCKIKFKKHHHTISDPPLSYIWRHHKSEFTFYLFIFKTSFILL